uniref:Uncharacterized protein n=1 Tax=Arundo donax TaxID=35708 RepID=A0A0A9U1Z4_ARUDO
MISLNVPELNIEITKLNSLHNSRCYITLLRIDSGCISLLALLLRFRCSIIY